MNVSFDQSQYVRDALENLQLEAVLGAVLASLIVLLFLGSLRSTWIVALSIPLSILAAFMGLYFTGHMGGQCLVNAGINHMIREELRFWLLLAFTPLY